MTDVEMKDAAPKAANDKKTDEEEYDLYMKMKELQAELEMLEVQEKHLKGEMRHLSSEYIYAQEEVSGDRNGKLTHEQADFGNLVSCLRF